MTDTPDMASKPTAEWLRSISLSTAVHRQAAMALRHISNYELDAQAEYVYRAIRETLQQVDNDAEPEGTDVRMHWLLSDLVLVRNEIRRRLELGTPIGKDGGRTLGDFAHDLKQRIDLPVFLAEFRLVPDQRRSGDHMVGRCPHHLDKTPSLHVWSTHSHCFGCNSSMDVYDWITVDGSSWVEALRIAAAFAGVAMPKPPLPPKTDKSRVPVWAAYSE